jgi:hypothetical protein
MSSAFGAIMSQDAAEFLHFVLVFVGVTALIILKLWGAL